jgi:hypothetical protein
MDTKLTIKLNKDVINQAKIYALSHKRSLSSIIESYLQTLVNPDGSEGNNEKIEISEFVKSMRTGVQIPSDVDAKIEYAKHVSEKYK